MALDCGPAPVLPSARSASPTEGSTAKVRAALEAVFVSQVNTGKPGVPAEVTPELRSALTREANPAARVFREPAWPLAPMSAPTTLLRKSRSPPSDPTTLTPPAPPPAHTTRPPTHAP